MNTIPPNDWSFFEMLNEVVQREPATSLDPELMGPLAAIGIIKGQPFAPDARMKRILTEALAVANATSRSLLLSPRAADWYPAPLQPPRAVFHQDLAPERDRTGALNETPRATRLGYVRNVIGAAR